MLGGRAIVLVLNRLGLAQGLHAPFVATGALVIFGLRRVVHASGFLAVYLAGLVVGNRQTRAHNTVVVFLDAVTWLAQIVMFVLLGLLAWPERLPQHALPALAVALTLMSVRAPGRGVPLPRAVPVLLAREAVHLLGRLARRGRHVPRLDPDAGRPARAQLFFDVGFVVVLVSLLVQGWTIASAARRLHIALPRHDPMPRRVELDLPGQLAQELVGYPVAANSPYLRRGLLPILGAADPGGARRAHPDAGRGRAGARGRLRLFAGAAREGAGARSFLRRPPPPPRPDPHLLGDFFVSGDVTLGALAEIYGLTVAPEDAATTLADYFAAELKHPPRPNDAMPLGPIELVAHTVADDRVARSACGCRRSRPGGDLAWSDQAQGAGLVRLG